jgi:polyhydroxyalkanoate synthesis repressor PhaR
MAGKHPSAVLIKRYGGGRLYNTVAANYLTLNDLARMVQEGRRLRVWDASTGEDITAETLRQAALKLH